MPARIDHLTLVVSDFPASLAFYDAALGALGLIRAAEYGDEEEADPALEAAGWSVPGQRPLLWIVAGPQPTQGAHLALTAPAPPDVQRFYAAAIGAGGTGRSAPRRWPIYRRGEFSAVVADPAGNLVEAFSPE